ncbi:MAG: fused MFS/spermidine synthase [Spirochaetes bacterium]|nr:fused MFS/spermidine synthase [Spirochaetota bacterium]
MEIQSPNTRRLGYLTAFAAGAVGLALEIIAGRLMAPFFGQSLVVWAGVISAVLLAVTAGSLVGGRMADGGFAVRGGYRYIPLAAALVASVTVIPFYRLLGVIFSGHTLSLALFTALLLLALGVFSLPVLVLATLLPMITRMLSAGRTDTGTVIGRVYAVNTLGSIAGAVSAALLLVPLAGLTWSVYIVESSLTLVSAVLVLAGDRPGGIASALLVSAAAAVVLSIIPWSCGDAADSAALSFDTPYNRVMIYRDADTIALSVNDPHFVQSIQYLDDEVRLDVWHLYLLGPALLEHGGTGRALFLGYGAGTAATLYRRHYPAMDLTGIELDPGMVRAGRKYLGDRSGARVIIGDARSALCVLSERFDVIVSDVFRFPYMPHHTATVEYFRLIRGRLARDGVLVYNCGRYDEDDTLSRGIARSIAAVFPHVQVLPLGRFNTMIFASRRSLAAVRPPSPRMAPLAVYYNARSRPFTPERGGEIFRDDRPVTEHLVHIMGMRYMIDEAFR